MRTAIVELDPDGQVIRSGSRSARRPHDRTVIAGLLVACTAFALSVWVGGPAPAPALAGRPAAAVSIGAAAPASALATSVDPGRSSYTYVLNGAGTQLLTVLRLPPNAGDVDLGTLPERLANEAAPSSWVRVITVRGISGIGSDDGPVFISWSEKGTLYWLSSSTHTTEELISIADEMR